MVELVALALVVATAALARVVFQQRDRLKQAAEALSRARTTLSQKHEALADLEASVKARDAAIKDLQSSLNIATEVARPGQPSSDALRDLAVRASLVALLADSTEDILLIIDHELRIVAWNVASLGVFPTLTAGKRLSEITDSPALLGLVENTLEYKDTELVEEQVTLGDPTYLVRVRYIKHTDGERIGLALKDISDLVKLNRARRDMVANISHELRHPIANIRLIIDGLFHEHDKPKRKESISSLRAIAHETDLLLWLVQSMADLSMIETGQAIVRMVDVNFNELVDAAIERLDNLTERKRMTIVKHVPAKLHVLCDRDLIQRVVVNLLHNAIKWSPEGGAITLEAEASGEEVVVSVLDNGPGVPADQVERIFERFYQVDSARSGKEGTGLGLAICKHIVTAHGGRIWAEGNQMGSGGKFKFTLLNADSSAASENPAPSAVETA